MESENRTRTLVDQSDYPFKRFKCNYVNDIDEQLVAGRDSPKQPNPPSPPSPTSPRMPPLKPPIFRYPSEGETPIYRGPSEGEGFRYICYVGPNSGDYDYDHTIFFKGDSFTVRENRRLMIPDEERYKRPPEDKRIRSIRDPNNFDFLEDLEAPVIPPATVICFDLNGLNFYC
ncbi:hypothetical protein AQUCO_01300155v1 [Aquilegia coerulea]|uniref:Uncharacterized protein n=1 Tax=Aquilegia coerulea TaxID=218851 RepID=A0A2G5E052_AQUCA|nr:hypothetical protein AQUCO_01300155v1 [Aquilegia coerulea]